MLFVQRQFLKKLWVMILIFFVPLTSDGLPNTSDLNTPQTSVVQNNEHITKMVNFNPWLEFATNIESCQSGSFHLPDPSEIMLLSLAQTALIDDPNANKKTEQEIITYLKKAIINYRILGYVNQKCVVVVEKNEEMFDPANSKQYVWQCQFAKDQQNLFAVNAKEIAAGHFEQIDPSIFIDTFAKQCQQKNDFIIKRDNDPQMNNYLSNNSLSNNPE